MVPALITVGVVLAVAAGVYFLTRRPAARPVVFANEREARLANAVAKKVGCHPGAALPSVREELRLAPSLPDEVLTRRAVYHYQQSIPERTCRTWRDRSPG